MYASECDCGSGETKLPYHDGYGIFMFYACHECYDGKLHEFRPDIMTQYECDEPIEEDY